MADGTGGIDGQAPSMPGRLPACNHLADAGTARQQQRGCMQHINAGEFALLLTVFWLPVFVVAAFSQWHLLGARRHRFAWLLLALLLECVLAFGVWLSPLHRHFLRLHFLGDFAIGSLPLQAAVLAAGGVTLLLWVIAKRIDASNVNSAKNA